MRCTTTASALRKTDSASHPAVGRRCALDWRGYFRLNHDRSWPPCRVGIRPWPDMQAAVTRCPPTHQRLTCLLCLYVALALINCLIALSMDCVRVFFLLLDSLSVWTSRKS